MKVSRLVVLLFLITSGCSTASLNSRTPSSGPAGVEGQTGDVGLEGRSGKSGSFNVEDWYRKYPLCQVGQLIAAANDLEKLHEFINAGCSVTVAGLPGSSASMYELAVAYERDEMLELILKSKLVRRQVDLYSPLGPVFPLNRLKVPLNPYEIAIYSRKLKNLETSANEAVFRNIYMDKHQLAMLVVLLAAADDSGRLKKATARALEHLKSSEYHVYSPVKDAIAAIESRIQELSK